MELFADQVPKVSFMFYWLPRHQRL
jgi:hypothetical protein